MTRPPDPALDRFLDGLAPPHRKIVAALRRAVAAAAPTAKETALWGGLSYHRPWVGGRVKGAVCQITAKRNEVRLDFIHGVRLRDPHGLLRGKLLSKRFVPIPTADEAERPGLAALIREAAAFDPGTPAQAPRRRIAAIAENTEEARCTPSGTGSAPTTRSST